MENSIGSVRSKQIITFVDLNFIVDCDEFKIINYTALDKIINKT